MSDSKSKVADGGKRWGIRWPLIVVGLLAAHVGGMVYAVALINHRTRTLGVVDNYYDQAVRWDEHQALMRESRALGWQVKIEPATEIDPAGRRAVAFTLTDAAGYPVTDATLDVTCIHPAHADAPVQASFPASKDGRFTQVLPMRYEGFYDFNVTAKAAGGKTFVTTVTQWVSTDGVRKGPNS
jgi:nitrogen fixation protein FixH